MQTSKTRGQLYSDTSPGKFERSDFSQKLYNLKIILLHISISIFSSLDSNRN